MVTKVIISNDTRILTDSIIRPDNATAYAAGDVISEVTTNDHLTFLKAMDPGDEKTGIILGGRIHSSANNTTLPDLELWLFDKDITEVADNGAFAPTDAEMLTLIGVIVFPVASWIIGNAGAAAAGNAFCEVMNLDIPFRLGKVPGALNIYGQLVVRNVYTPVASETFSCNLMLRVD